MAFPSTGILDSFDRADGSAGPDWTDGTFPAPTIRSNRAYASAWVPAVWQRFVASDCEVHATVSADGGLVYARAGGNPFTDGYAFGVDNGGWAALSVSIGGTSRSLAAGWLPGGLRESDGDGIGLRCDGSRIQAWFRPGPTGAWQLIYDVTDTALAAVGRIVYIPNGFAGWFDAFGGGSIGALLFDGSFADGTFGDWKIQNSTVDATLFGSDTDNTIARSSRGRGSYAMTSFVGARTTDGTTGPRAEVYTDLHATRGDDFWIGMSIWIPSSPNETNGWAGGHHTLMQMKQDGTGSPPWQLDLRHWRAGDPGNGLMLEYVRPSTGSGYRYELIIPERDLYDSVFDFAIHCVASDDETSGLLELYLDGTRAFSTPAATMAPGLDSYLKAGLYGGGSVDTPPVDHAVEHMAIRWGRTRAVVDPSLLYP